MVDFHSAILEQIIFHNVGNKLRNEGITFVETPVVVEEDTKTNLMYFFLSAFKTEEFYEFDHPTGDLQSNVLYKEISSFFNHQSSLLELSKNLSKILYSHLNHPKIKGGEFYVAHFKDCIFDDLVVDAVGLFKTENKETYLKNSLDGSIWSEIGTNIKRPDKGCLILNDESSTGYRIMLVASSNQDNSSQYWKEFFLGARPMSDKYHTTNNFLSLTKDFVKNQLLTDPNVDHADQADILNKSMNFFKENKEFDHDQFMNTVLEKPELIDSFRHFETQFQEENDVKIPTSFEISEQAVKKKTRVFKSVLKLDKNFHIYIHGNRELIEKGVDSDSGKKFYKIYYDHETQ